MKYLISMSSCKIVGRGLLFTRLPHSPVYLDNNYRLAYGYNYSCSVDTNYPFINRDVDSTRPVFRHFVDAAGKPRADVVDGVTLES
jgi:hypothetical protein